MRLVSILNFCTETTKDDAWVRNVERRGWWATSGRRKRTRGEKWMEDGGRREMKGWISVRRTWGTEQRYVKIWLPFRIACFLPSGQRQMVTWGRAAAKTIWRRLRSYLWDMHMTTRCVRLVDEDVGHESIWKHAQFPEDLWDECHARVDGAIE